MSNECLGQEQNLREKPSIGKKTCSKKKKRQNPKEKSQFQDNLKYLVFKIIASNNIYYVK